MHRFITTRPLPWIWLIPDETPTSLSTFKCVPIHSFYTASIFIATNFTSKDFNIEKGYSIPSSLAGFGAFHCEVEVNNLALDKLFTKPFPFSIYICIYIYLWDGRGVVRMIPRQCHSNGGMFARTWRRDIFALLLSTSTDFILFS